MPTGRIIFKVQVSNVNPREVNILSKDVIKKLKYLNNKWLVWFLLSTIFNFLAILELIQESKVKLSIGQGLNNFWITDLS